MTLTQAVIAGCLLVLAVAHSALGENTVLRPLFANDWTIAIPRPAAEKILRFAWHLTSFAWLALAAIVAGADHFVAVGILSLLSAGLIFATLRGHLAWPIFLLAGAASLREAGVLDETWLRAGAAITAGLLLIAAAAHVYWALGGRLYLDRTLPPTSQDGFTPGPVLTLGVALALTVFAGLIGLVAFEADSAVLRALVIAGVVVLVARAIGDRRVAGFTKTVRNTDFAIADDRFFTPLCVLLAHGAAGALLV
ncbi:MAG: DUF3995 domain-containing protein [Acidimicrobiales bacterium]